MSHARTYPTLLARIEQQQSRPTSIDTRTSGVRPPDVASYSERYRGTEYESPLARPTVVPAPAMSPGRKFLIVSAAALTTILGAGLIAALG